MVAGGLDGLAPGAAGVLPHAAASSVPAASAAAAKYLYRIEGPPSRDKIIYLLHGWPDQAVQREPSLAIYPAHSQNRTH